MKLRSIRLERFRQFEDTTIEVGDFNLLVGPNNCGKTSILHAIRAFFILMHGHVRFEGEPPTATYHRRFLTGAEEVAPTPDIRELWYRQQTGKPLRITVTFEDDASFSVVLRQQFGQLHVSAEGLPEGLTAQKVTKYLGIQVAFIPGLVGVLVSEPYATQARRNALATQGRYSEIFRSSIQQLNSRNPELLAKINEWLEGLFAVTVSAVAFNQEADEFVTVRYQQHGVQYDVVSSGSGLQQIIQMLTYLYLAQPRVLLIDEPDAHLHSKLQARLGDLFRRVSRDLEAQVFLSTHSVDLIDTFSTNDVLVIDSTKRKIGAIGDNSDLISTLVDADVVDVSALSRLLSSRRLVVIEDADQALLKAIDKVLGSPLFSASSNSYVLSAKGVGNFRAIAELGRVLAGLTGATFELTFVQDRDGMPDFIEEVFVKSQEADGVQVALLQRHETESYLIEPKLFSLAGKRLGRRITAAHAKATILAAAKATKAKARRLSLATAIRINRHLDGVDRKGDADLEEAVYAWFDGLDVASLETIQRVWPGKELLQESLKRLNKRTTKPVTRGKLVAALEETMVPEELVQLLQKLGKVGPDNEIQRPSSRQAKRCR